MRAIHLETEYLKEPLGIDILSPRITWCDTEGKRQSAFQILFQKEGKVIFDTGKVLSSTMHYDVNFQLYSRDEIHYQIRLWDEEDKVGEWTSSSFEMGLLNPKDFQADWITLPIKVNKKKRYPVSYFKKEFEVNSIEKARLYITACGIYEARINGKRVGDFIFAPGSTDYRKRLQYQTYDVTPFLKEGENEILVEVADGYYRGSIGAKGRRNTYGKVTKLFLQLEWLDLKGEKHQLISDSSFSCSKDGPLLFADLKDGEVVDNRKSPSYSFKAKKTKCNFPLCASNNVFVKEQEHFTPIKQYKAPNGKTILEFKQNLSGYIAFHLKAKEGQKIHIRLGEMLDQDGNLTLKNIQCTYQHKKTPLQEITFLCKEGENEYKTKYFYGGFQYAEIDTDISFEKENFEQIAVYSDMEETSSFHCSNELLNQFYQNTLWSLKSNSTDVPTDCPTRERMGWTGDSQIFFNTASYMVNYASFSRKHVRDIFDRQWKSGKLPQIAPFSNEDWFMYTMNGSVGWACAGVYIPYYFYLKYGDKRILEEYYSRILKYADFMISRAGKWGGIYAKPVFLSKKNRKYFVNRGQSYGEWAEPSDVCAFKWYDFASPHPEESTAYTYFTLQRVLEIAKILNKKEDKELKKIKEYSIGAKSAYQELVTKKNFTLDTDRQAKLVRPLYMGLLNEEQEAYAKDRLIQALDHYQWRLGTGFLSTPMILDVLSGIDIEYAYRLLLNEEMPGWLFMVKNKATTIWESWEGNTTKEKGLASLNHYSKGAVCEWMIKTMAGIQIQGENHFHLEPKPGKEIKEVEASYQSIYGKVLSSYRREGNQIHFHFEVPSNTIADIVLEGRVQKVESGVYDFVIEER